MKSQIEISQSVSLLANENIVIVHKKKAVVTLKIEPQLTLLFLELLYSKNELVSKDYLIKSIWKDNIYVGQSALRKNIYKLRFLIKNNNLEDELSITTVPKKGYKLIVQPSNSRNIIPIIKSRSSAFLYVSAAIFILFFSLKFSTEEDIILKQPTSDIEIISNGDFFNKT
ncbi:helix-turn-helix domain-containing protein [uncultured Psychroserpens sp.]|uniref:winged helix-turn-helix domain-containing protein n=1 Tax=uncultured Psychroserpens sp. TaxID=255436 RepID=UPI0026300977|nr:helix-turn-helix domain-containing protein [uncultured Psychroserpens sp.]